MSIKSCLALIDKAKQYIKEEIAIRWDGDFEEYVVGVLESVITSPDNMDEAYFIVANSDGKYEVPVNEIMQFLPKRMLADENAQFFYVVIRFGKTERSKEHYYMSYDYNIKPGDKVLVWQDWLYVGNVIRVGFFPRNEAPYPVEKTYLVQKKVYPRIDFLQYEEAATLITSDNSYKDKALNSENDYKQFLAATDTKYQWLAEEHSRFLDSRRPETDDPEHMARFIVGQTEYELDWEWCESNQIEVFYRTLWICVYMAKHNCYSKFYFDKYMCLSLIYKRGQFDSYMLSPNEDKVSIQKDIDIVDEHLRRMITV